jgi:hypothetical protein
LVNLPRNINAGTKHSVYSIAKEGNRGYQRKV